MYTIFFKPSEFKIGKCLGDFGHCVMVHQDSNGVFIGVDPCVTGMLFNTIDSTRMKFLRDNYLYVDIDDEIVEANSKSILFIPRIPSCVSAIKMMLGIRKPFILTPRQL